MKRSTLMAILLAFLIVPFTYGQNFTSGISAGFSQSTSVANLTRPIIVNTPTIDNNLLNQRMAVVEVTHNTSNILETGFRCILGNNSFYRDFDLAGDFGIVEHLFYNYWNFSWRIINPSRNNNCYR